GPKEEVRTVRRIFMLFVRDRLSEAKIADHLNERRILTRLGNKWTKKTVHEMLGNPKYVGDLAFRRTRTYIGSRPVNNSRDKWIYVPDQFPPIVKRDVW